MNVQAEVYLEALRLQNSRRSEPLPAAQLDRIALRCIDQAGGSDAYGQTHDPVDDVLKQAEAKINKRKRRKSDKNTPSDAKAPFGTENYLAETFVDKHGNKLRYTDDLKRWNHFDGARWEEITRR